MYDALRRAFECFYVTLTTTENKVSRDRNKKHQLGNQWRTQEYFSGGGGVQQIYLRTESKESGDLRAIAP
jgi:hypothetical protein